MIFPKRTAQRLARIFLGFILIQIVFLSGGTLYQTWASAQEATAFPAPGQLVNIGGYALHLHCEGQSINGSPTIILEGGFGAPAVMWSLVQPSLAEHTRVCAYDRAGYGWSDASPYPRTAQQIATELHFLLQYAEEEPPYLLVGHSFGSMVARVYAATDPEAVSGLILLDPRHEDFFERMPADYLQIDQRNLQAAQALHWLTPIGATRLLGATGQLSVFEKLLAPLPDEAEAVAWATMIYRPQHWATAVAEREASALSYEQVRNTALPADLPLIVLTAENGFDAWQLNNAHADTEAQTIWLALQEEQAHLTTNGQWIIVPESGHYIYLDQPAAIAEAVEQLLK